MSKVKIILVLLGVAITFLTIGIFIGKGLNCETKEEQNNLMYNDNKEIEEIEENQDTVKLSNNWTKIENFKCLEMTEAIDLNPQFKLFITKNNELYQYSTDKIFSNGKNCKKVDTDIKMQKFIDDRVIVDVDNNLYTYVNDKLTELKVPSKNASDSDKIDFSSAVVGPGQLQSLNEKDYKNISYINYEFRKYYYFHLKNGNVYNYMVSFNDSNETVMKDYPGLADQELVQLDPDENIELFIDGTIKTNKGYYLFENRIMNKEDVEKFADAKPEYKIGYYKLQDTNIISQKDKIVFLKQLVNTYDNSIYIVTNEGELITIKQ